MVWALKGIRDFLPETTPETVFQKVLGQPYIDPQDVLVEDEYGNVQIAQEAGTLHLGGADEYTLGARVEFAGGPGPIKSGGPNIVGETTSYTDSTVGGFASVADDVSHLSTPEALYNQLRMDYPGTTFTSDDSSVYVMRFQVREVSDVSVPYGRDMGGTVDKEPPFTGNGFTQAKDDIIPEYYFPNGASIQPGAEIWEITSDGNQRLVAVFNGETWIPVMG